jgi:hypothetical protein
VCVGLRGLELEGAREACGVAGCHRRPLAGGLGQGGESEKLLYFAWSSGKKWRVRGLGLARVASRRCHRACGS